MNQIKISKRDNFTVVDNHFIRDDNLSWKAKGLLIYLLHLPNDWIVSLSDLKNRSKDGRDSTNNGIKELMEKGYVTREQLKVKNKFDGYEYTVTELPFTENPSTYKTSTGNPPLLSTKELSTKETNIKELKQPLVHSKLDDTFNEFWNTYNKKTGRKKCLSKWKLLKVKDREAIMKFLPSYIKSTPDIKFRQHPYTFLNSCIWEDEYLEGGNKQQETLGQNGKPFEKKRKKVCVGRDNFGRNMYEWE